MMTGVGMILGTAAYMSPEQARGKVVDKRADIWAFGVVLYEMLAGRRAFPGEDITETLAAVVMKEPDLENVPYEVRRLLRKCLQKGPRNRLRDIGDAWDYLDSKEPAPVVKAARPSSLPWIATGVATLALLAGAGWIYTHPVSAPESPVMRFTVPPPADALLTTRNTGATQQAISPDGRSIVFVADSTRSGTSQTLWVRPIDSEKAQRLAGTEGANLPFWSPDSKHIAYFTGNTLKRVPATGGSPLTVAPFSNPGASTLVNRLVAQGGSWFQDDSTEGVILFAPYRGTIFRVAAAGGIPEAVTTLKDGETQHVSPQILPDGKRFLYLAIGATPGIYVQELGSQERTRLLDIGTRAVFAPPDLLLYLRDNSLLAQHWDWSSLKPVGEPVQVADSVRNAGTGRSSFSVSATGALLYREGLGGGTARYQWFLRDGTPLEYATPRLDLTNVELSPDGRQAVLRANGDLYLVDLGSGVVSALTNDEPSEAEPKWSPDGRRIVFHRPDGLYQAVVGSGQAARFSTSTAYPEAWLPEGILVNDTSRLVLLPAPGEDVAGPSEQAGRVLAELLCDEVRVAPGGKSVAYVIQRPNGYEAWVADFPSIANRRKVADGMAPLWRSDGRELFFVDNNIVKSVDVTLGTSPTFGPPRTLINVPGLAVASALFHQYAVSADGQRLLLRVNGEGSGEVESLHVVLNWPSLVK